MHRIAKSLSAVVLSVAFLLTLSPAYQQNLSAEITDRAKAAVAKEVRHELVTLPYYGVFDNLAFRVDDDGALTLLGQVTRRIVKDSTPTPARPAPSS